MTESGFDIFKNISVFHAKKEGLKAVEPFEAKRDKVAGFITGLVSEDEATRSTSNTELSTWWKTEVGDTGPANIQGLRELMETEKKTIGVDSPQYQKHLETYHAVVQAQTLVVQDMLVEDWQNNWEHSLVGDAAISLRHDNRPEIAEGFDNVFGSNVLVGGAREVSANLITDERILKQLDRLVEDSVDGFNSRDVGKYKDKLDRLDDDDDVNTTDYKIAREYLVNLRNRVDEIEAATRGRGVARVKQVGIGAETPDGVPGGTEYESPFAVTLPNFVDALMTGGQVRFDYSDLPKWALHEEILDKGQRMEAVLRECVRAKIHEISDKKKYFGEGDFQKMRLNSGFEMTQRELAIYFNHETQRAGQFFVQDLMEFYTKENGIKMMVFKTKEDGINPTDYVVDRVSNLNLFSTEIALRLALYNKGKNKGESESHFRTRITLASNKWFNEAVKYGEKHPGQVLDFPEGVEVSSEDKLSAYSMREFMFMSLAFSQADRTRIFTPIPRAIQDPERYVIWMNQKLKRKVGGEGKKGVSLKQYSEEELENSKYTTGSDGTVKELSREDIEKLMTGQFKAETATLMQTWAQQAMDIEEVLGEPLDGNKYVSQKIFDGDIVFGPESLCIGYMDILPVEITNEDGRKIDKDGHVILDEKKQKPMTMVLSEALMKGKFFTPGTAEKDTMASFRDAMEQGGDAFAYFKGEIPFPFKKGQREIDDWIKKRNKVLGLTRDINQNGRPVFTDVLRDPKAIESLIIGCFGVDPSSIAVGRPVVACPDPSIRATWTNGVVDAMRLMADWAHPDEVKNLLEGRPVNQRRIRFNPLADTIQGVLGQKEKFRAAKLMEMYNEKRKTHPRREY